jgi:hypothetical protein
VIDVLCLISLFLDEIFVAFVIDCLTLPRFLRTTYQKSRKSLFSKNRRGTG